MAVVHASAVVDPGAEIADDVEIGPGAVIGAGVKLAPGCRVGPHCVIEGETTLGDGCVLTSHAALGTAPQDLKYGGEPTRLLVGARNTFREFVTLNRGTESGGGLTTVGDDNLFMTGAHVAHDCHVGSDVIFANNATLGGHVSVASDSTIGAFAAVHQFCRVGPHAFIGGFSVCTKDVLPYMKTVGSRGDVRAFGPNKIGLERKGFASESIEALGRAFRRLRRPSGRTEEALDELLRDSDVPEMRVLVEFVRQSLESRGYHA